MLNLFQHLGNVWGTLSQLVLMKDPETSSG